MFYPAPAHSSICHNPKYIKQDVSAPPADAGRPHVLHGKPRKQHRATHRKRMSVKDIDDWDLPSYDALYDHELLTPVAETRVENDEDAALSVDDDVTGVERGAPTECHLLGSLVEKAERLQRLLGRTPRPRRRKKSGSKTCGPEQGDDKSHIVYLPAAPARDSEEDVAAPHGAPSTPPVSAPPSQSTRVLLPTHDVTVTSLKDCFGHSYFEAACRPRKFVLDITSRVRELLKKRGVQAKVADHTDDAFSYLVFTHDGFYDDEHDVYKVSLNCRLRPGLLAVQVEAEAGQALYRGPAMDLVSRAVDSMDGVVTDLVGQNHFPLFLDKVPIKAGARQLMQHLGSSEAYVPSVQRVFRLGSAVCAVTVPSLSDMLQEEPAFCDVCYDDVSPLTPDSAAATALLKCGHRVCDSCWSQHVHSRLRQGFVRVTCPGYDCQGEVSVGVLLSVAPLDAVEKLLHRQEEVRIGASRTEKWCPHAACRRVIRLQPPSSAAACGEEPELQQDVVCACGAHVCFRCLFPAHWPASCKQAEEYRARLAAAAFPDREAAVHDDSRQEREAKRRREEEKKNIMIVQGKHCPRCKSFVFRDGGCPQMTCSCGQLFCWQCGKPGYSHPNRAGCVSAEEEKKLTTTLVVRHLDVGKSVEEQKEEQERRAAASRRQRVSLLERAADHRRLNHPGQQHKKVIGSLAKCVATAAAKDKAVAQHVLRVCSGASSASSSSASSSSAPFASPDPADHPSCQSTPQRPPSCQSPPQGPPFCQSPPQRPPSVVEAVTAFLTGAARSKQELREVAEFSLVLLKDLPDSLLRRRALRISEDLGAFCTFTQSIFDAWGEDSGQGRLQEAVKVVTRLAEIQGWINSALATHVVTVKKLRTAASGPTQ